MAEEIVKPQMPKLYNKEDLERMSDEELEAKAEADRRTRELQNQVQQQHIQEKKDAIERESNRKLMAEIDKANKLDEQIRKAQEDKKKADAKLQQKNKELEESTAKSASWSEQRKVDALNKAAANLDEADQRLKDLQAQREQSSKNIAAQREQKYHALDNAHKLSVQEQVAIQEKKDKIAYENLIKGKKEFKEVISTRQDLYESQLADNKFHEAKATAVSLQQQIRSIDAAIAETKKNVAAGVPGYSADDIKALQQVKADHETRQGRAIEYMNAAKTSAALNSQRIEINREGKYLPGQVGLAESQATASMYVIDPDTGGLSEEGLAIRAAHAKKIKEEGVNPPPTEQAKKEEQKKVETKTAKAQEETKKQGEQKKKLDGEAEARRLATLQKIADSDLYSDEDRAEAAAAIAAARGESTKKAQDNVTTAKEQDAKRQEDTKKKAQEQQKKIQQATQEADEQDTRQEDINKKHKEQQKKLADATAAADEEDTRAEDIQKKHKNQQKKIQEDIETADEENTFGADITKKHEVMVKEVEHNINAANEDDTRKKALDQKHENQIKDVEDGINTSKEEDTHLADIAAKHAEAREKHLSELEEARTVDPKDKKEGDDGHPLYKYHEDSIYRTRRYRSDNERIELNDETKYVMLYYVEDPDNVHKNLAKSFNTDDNFKPREPEHILGQLRKTLEPGYFYKVEDDKILTAQQALALSKKPAADGKTKFGGKFVRSSYTNPFNLGQEGPHLAVDSYTLAAYPKATHADPRGGRDSTVKEQFSMRFFKMGINAGVSKSYADRDNNKAASAISDTAAQDFKIIDSDWIQSRFMTPTKQLSVVDAYNRFFSTTGWKYTSTRAGHHWAVNPRPQFTRTADIKGNNENYSRIGHGFYKGDCTNQFIEPPTESARQALGMGRYYSEAIDDNATLIYLQFGVPKFNSIIEFFTRAVDGVDVFVANHGRLPWGYTVGQILGIGAAAWCFPYTSIIIGGIKWIFGFWAGGPFKYYYMQPQMILYWGAVSQLVTQLATELGILTPFVNSSDKTANKITRIGNPLTINSEDLSDIHAYYPNMVSKISGFIDVYAIATQAQKLGMENLRNHIELNKKYDEDTLENLTKSPEYWVGYMGNPWQVSSRFVKKTETAAYGTGWFAEFKRSVSLLQFAKKLTKKNAYYDSNRKATTAGQLDTKSSDGWTMSDDETPLTKNGTADSEEAKAEAEQKKNAENKAKAEGTDASGWFTKVANMTYDAASEVGATLGKWFSWVGDVTASNATTFAAAFDAMMSDGGEFAVFAVDYQGTVSDSFSNSVSEIATGETLKSVAAGARDVRFNLAGGSLGAAIDGVIEGIKGVAMGFLDAVTMGLSNVIRTITGGAYVDLPKKWDDSDMQLPSVSYTIDLVSPYGNTWSQLQNIYIPLCMLLAGTLPLKAGEASYTSPFLCSLYNKGVQEIQLGMITELSIERGITNLSYTKNKRCLSLRVSFTVTDFSTRLSVPVSTGLLSDLKENFRFTMEDTSPMHTYLATLASRDLYTSKYMEKRMQQRMSRLAMGVSRAFSADMWGMKAAHGLQSIPLIGPVIKSMYPGVFVPQQQSNSTSPFG